MHRRRPPDRAGRARRPAARRRWAATSWRSRPPNAFDGMALTDAAVHPPRPPGRSAQPDPHRRRRRHGHAGRGRRDRPSAAARSSSPASSASRSTRCSPRSSRATRRPVRPPRRPTIRPDTTRATARARRRAEPPRRPRHEGARDDDPAPAGPRRQGAGRGHAPAGRARQPRVRAVPDHGRLRARLQRRAAAARDRRRHPAGVGPAVRRRGLPGPRRWRAAHQRGRPGRGHRGGRAWPAARPTSWSSRRPTPRRSSAPASSR